jgi:hypothetical protein
VVVLRNLDVVVLAIALAVFLAAGLPVLGWVTAAVIWAMWRGIGTFAERKAQAAEHPRQMVGITTGSMIGRGWLMGLTLVAVGLAAGDDVGLSAAVLCAVLFTVSFTTKLVLSPMQGSGTSSTQ